MAKNHKTFQWDFVLTVLTEKEKQSFAIYTEDNLNQVVTELISVLDQGYKVSARLDLERDIWIVALSGTDQSVYNHSATITSRHHTLEEAILLTCFKNNEIARRGEWRDDKSESAWG